LITVGDIDLLYHLLRKVHNSNDPELIESVSALSKHLLCGGDYPSLLKFLSYYGTNFLLEDIIPIMRDIKQEEKFERVVEFGCGYSWLSLGLYPYLDYVPTWKIDKRNWSLVDLVADLETTSGQQKVLDTLKPNDIIIMSEFIHCLDDPYNVMLPFKKWPKVVIEYMPTYPPDFSISYMEQISKYGCSPVTLTYLLNEVFGKSISKVEDLYPYVLVYVKGVE